MDISGDTLWTKHIGMYGRNEWGYSLDKTSDGGYIVAGIYKIICIAENLPSGVYFYQLRAGEFIETKKMILLK